MSKNLIPIMNNTKWDELRLAMDNLGGMRPRLRTKDVENGYTSNWDREWFHHFRIGGYKTIEWVEVFFDSDIQRTNVTEILELLHIPVEITDKCFRIYGYIDDTDKINILHGNK
jgi:hypothetical protein